MGELALPGWVSCPEGLQLGSLLVSFQRYPLPAGAVIRRAPPSLGALPVALTPSGFLLPIDDDEAFWIGVVVPAPAPLNPFRISAILLDATEVVVASLSEPRTHVLAGMLRADDQFDAFCRGSIEALGLSVGDCTALVRPTDPATFSASTGRPAPAPLDRSAGYRGWRLP